MKKLPKILFRTSGGTAYGKELGMGHVYRSINLASHLKKSKIFFLIEDYGSVKQIISQRNFNFLILILMMKANAKNLPRNWTIFFFF